MITNEKYITNTKNTSKIAPLSFSQQRIWFLEQIEPDSSRYNINLALKLKGKLDVSSLEKSFNKTIERHETFRTTFDILNDQPVQIVAPKGDFSIDVMDLKHMSDDNKNAETEIQMQQLFSRSFSLSKGPLMRVNLLLLEESEQIIFVSIHHIITDDWSIKSMMKEIFASYFAYCHGIEPQLPSLSMQYTDFALWQHAWFKSDEVSRDLQYWKDKLSNAPILQLPIDYTRPAVQTANGATFEFVIPKSTSDEIVKLSKDNDSSVFMLLISTFYILLSRYSGQTDISIGTPFAERSQIEFEEILGLFVNTLVMRMDVSANQPFTEFLHKVKQMAIEAYSHGKIPFEKIVEEIQPERTLDNNPLFQVMFSFYNEQRLSAKTSTLELNQIAFDNKTSKFDLTLYMTQRPSGLSATFEYNTDLFKAETIQRMATHFQILLENIIKAPDSEIGIIPMLSEQEYNQIVNLWNDTAVDYKRNNTLHSLFEEQVEKTPENIALVFHEQQMTYRELNTKVNKLARHLKKHAVGPDVMVGLCMERSFELVIAIYSVIKAGGAYVPIDPTYPKERLEMMIEDSNAPLILAQEKFGELLAKTHASIIFIDNIDKNLEGERDDNVSLSIDGNNLAYVIFTSGSTGRPKGVMNVHKGISNRLLWMQEKYQLDETDRVLQKTPFSFDVSVWEFFWPLLNGAALVIAKPEGHKDVPYLLELINTNKITTLHFVPSMLQVFMEAPDAHKCTSLMRVICSGEALTPEMEMRFYKTFSSRLYNLYGPTEASVDVTYWDCDLNMNLKIVPIGKPIANTQIYILDSKLNPTPIGIPGELHIGGIGLARGYVNKPGLTAEKFIPNPFISGTDSKLYKTGDLARYLPDGNIEFLGRIDNQIKIRGLRIELGEIENSIMRHPAVSQAIVLCIENDSYGKSLIAYVVFEKEKVLSVEELSGFLRDTLPDYMIPSNIITLKDIPLLPNGKINRNALPKPDKSKARNTEFLAPQTDMEKTLAGIWCEVLGVEKVGVSDNFFDIGGHSLLLFKVQIKLKQITKVDISIIDMFKYPTISSLVKFLNKEPEKDENIIQNSKMRADIRKESIERSRLRRKTGKALG